MDLSSTTDTQTTNEAANVKVIPLIAVLLSGAFVAILNETVLNVALQAIMGDLGVAASHAQWLVTGYMLIIGTLIPISAFFIQRFSTRQLFITAMGLFTLGTLVAGFSPSFSVLLIGRMIQAVGTAIMIPLLMNVILVIIPIDRRGAAMGMIGLVIMFAPAIGPTVSGLIVQNLSWRWLFFIVLPISLASLMFGLYFLKNVTKLTKPKLDILSFILSTLGFGGIVLGFSMAGEGEATWMDPEVIGSLTIGVISLILFAWRQVKMDTPQLDVRVFRYPMFTLGLVMIITVMMTLFAMMLVLPIYMQTVLAFTAVTTGLVMLPGGIINGAMSPIMGKFFDKYGPRALLIPGATLMVISVFSYRFIDASTPITFVVIQHTLLMISVAMIMMPSQTNGLNQLPAHLYPHGAAIANTLMQVSGAIGAALFISIMENGQHRTLEGIQNPTPAQQVDALAVGAQQSFSTGFILACIVLFVSLFIKSSLKHSKKEESFQ
ncbi:MDR family MFS transporter [Alkalicoccobacillus murimartini]|uniref:DHA2 family lincomycin resistance protein-like MFS transporter n=1 Tax=Alkalicoccobacillus murimartini TaxID=171685 RepID=A0ABT9YIW7_9BACI|nr:MDR family MFS transporter [Alkalicoccobacillus murimartini]MDQ0207801.1 DHA2 family lincomycin resistance protein-like MFS transporter [Alkalicoccobacillus murimartini]